MACLIVTVLCLLFKYSRTNERVKQTSSDGVPLVRWSFMAARQWPTARGARNTKNAKTEQMERPERAERKQIRTRASRTEQKRTEMAWVRRRCCAKTANVQRRMCSAGRCLVRRSIKPWLNLSTFSYDCCAFFFLSTDFAIFCFCVLLVCFLLISVATFDCFRFFA